MDNDNSTRHHCAHEADFGIFGATIVEIKETLKELKDCVTSSAVAEERAAIFYAKLTDVDTRLRIVEINVAKSKGANVWTERVVWAVLSLALSALLAKSKGVL